MAVNPISFGPQHLRPMGHACGEPNRIKMNTHPKNPTALFREQGTARPDPKAVASAAATWLLLSSKVDASLLIGVGTTPVGTAKGVLPGVTSESNASSPASPPASPPASSAPGARYSGTERGRHNNRALGSVRFRGLRRTTALWGSVRCTARQLDVDV